MYAVEIEAGVGEGTLQRWVRDMPRLDTLEAVLKVMGYRLKIEKVK